MNTPYSFKFIWTISLAAAMGGLLFGYDWVRFSPQERRSIG
ncbi:hypothetical protein [Rubellicoccus peritrichatus]|uniref:Uncharacterized protein n=1 Tax=Rubellicoccus peritrichatus TaxID=3080537 RepID=A0AAQ3QQU6_9BACT|nr:hypothetical protein [Puniceicoccus sp. CR14]WOO40628.1 hypothetical protein RZN69_18555 [Puniceicoccus sp. CR14]